MDIDSRLIQIFYEIYRHKSVSKAATALGTGQSTLSIGLNKLREHFNNPLFVRVGNNMEPTDLAKDIFPITVEFLEKLKLINHFNIDFDPKTSHYEFTISMTDISHLVLLPKLSNYLRQNAPHISLNIKSIDAETSTQMADGKIDLVIGYMPHLEAGYYQQTLFKQEYTVICSPYHPRLIKGELTTEEYNQELHIDIWATGGHHMIETELRKRGVNRNILMRLPGYLGVGPIIKGTDAIATVPYYLSRFLQSRGDIKILTAPYSFPQYSVKQYWHERSHNNPNIEWLRRICFELFSEFEGNFETPVLSFE